jgi:hypothetical protein
MAKTKRTTNQGVIEAFFNGETNIESYTGNLWIDLTGTRLFNYATCLVQRDPSLNKIIINFTNYSVTTSQIQGKILATIDTRLGPQWRHENSIIVNNVKIGASYLTEYAKQKLEWLKGFKEVRLINYFDVWGNKKDGWEINNMCEEGRLRIHEDYTNKEIMQALKGFGFLKNTVRINQLEFDHLHDFGIEIYQKKDMKPICRLEWVREKVTN